MDLNALIYFQEVAKRRSFSLAAQSLMAQQASVSRAIQSLESELGVQLLNRTTRQVHVTLAGSRLLKETQVLLEHLADIPSAVRGEERPFQGRLPFAISDSLSQELLPSVLKEFSSKYPKVIPSIVTGNHRPLIREVEEGSLDFALFLGDVDHASSVFFKPVCAVSIFLAISYGHRKDKKIRSSFIGAREYEEGRSPPQQEALTLKSLGINAETRFSANSYAIHKELVLNGMGISFFPEYAVRKEVKEKRLFILNSNNPFRQQLNLYSRKNGDLPLKAQTFVDLLVDRIENHGQNK